MNSDRETIARGWPDCCWFPPSRWLWLIWVSFGSKLALYQHFLLHLAARGGEAPTPPAGRRRGGSGDGPGCPEGSGQGARPTATSGREPLLPPSALPGCPLPTPVGSTQSSNSLITETGGKHGASCSPPRPLGSNPHPRPGSFLVGPFVWPGLSSSCHFGGIPKAGDGKAGVRGWRKQQKRMPRRTEGEGRDNE